MQHLCMIWKKFNVFHFYDLQIWALISEKDEKLVPIVIYSGYDNDIQTDAQTQLYIETATQLCEMIFISV